jgi:hypothetical protein
LSIKITDFFNQTNFVGFRISVVHELYGVVFACCLNTSGPVVDTDVPDMNTNVILAQLAKFGFCISYSPRKHLSGEQISYLMTLQKLNFDKLRLLEVYSYINEAKHGKLYVVAFNITTLPDWMDNEYAASESEFTEALKSGAALNLTEVSASYNFSWDWLDYVANIEDILLDQSIEE